MSVRIRPGDRQPDDPGYVPDPYLDRVEDNSGIRSIFAEEPGSESEPGPQLFGLQRPVRNWSGTGGTRMAKLVAIAVLGSLAVVLLGAFVLRLGGSGEPKPAAVAPPEPSPTSVANSPGPARERAADVEVSAVPWQGAALPVSEQAGPRLFDDVRSSGFSQDEWGAALAAVHLSTHLDALTGPPVFETVIEHQSVKVPNDLLDDLRAGYEKQARASGLPQGKVRRGAPVIAPTGHIRGWRIEAFTPEAGVDVDLVVRDVLGRDVFYRVPVIWRSGDWRVSLAEATAERLFEPVPNPDPDTFTPFTTGGTAP